MGKLTGVMSTVSAACTTAKPVSPGMVRFQAATAFTEIPASSQQASHFGVGRNRHKATRRPILNGSHFATTAAEPPFPDHPLQPRSQEPTPAY
jgi:hypothetical protein